LIQQRNLNILLHLQKPIQKKRKSSNNFFLESNNNHEKQQSSPSKKKKFFSEENVANSPEKKPNQNLNPQQKKLKKIRKNPKRESFLLEDHVQKKNLNEQGLTHCYLLTFASEQDRDGYIEHKEHKKFVGLIVPQIDKISVVDYWAKNV